MKKILEMPDYLKGMIVECYSGGCPFWDNGDSGYGDHCNLIQDDDDFTILELKKIRDKIRELMKKYNPNYKMTCDEVNELLKEQNQRLREIFRNPQKYCPLRDTE